MGMQEYQSFGGLRKCQKKDQVPSARRLSAPGMEGLGFSAHRRMGRVSESALHGYAAQRRTEQPSGGDRATGKAMFSQLVKQMADTEGITEQLKAENQLLWVQRMNNVRERAAEIVTAELIYT